MTSTSSITADESPGAAAIPPVGLGFWKVDAGIAASLVETAAQIGYRHFDCACDYGNEAGIGEGLARVMAGGVDRSELWVTSKLWNTYHRPQHVRAACERSLAELGLDYLDLYLVHFPIALKFVPFETRYPPEWIHDPSAADPRMEYDPVPLADTWGAMEELKDAGLVREIGVSNYNIGLLRETLAGCRHRPAVLQVELHPYLTQETLLRFCRQEGVAVTGFSPLGAGSYVSIGMASADENVLRDPVVTTIAADHARTPAQVCLRWAVQRGTSVVPKSTDETHLRENLAVFDFELSDAEMAAITALDRGRRFNDPVDFGQAAFNTFFPIYE